MKRYSRHQQRGVSLVIVLVMVMLSMLLVLGGTRMTVLNEALVGNDSDYQRAFEAAQALLRDAEQDVRGLDATGALCTTTCRSATSAQIFPRDMNDYQALALATATLPWPCINGVCTNLAGNTTDTTANSSNFWQNTSYVTAMSLIGSVYGAYTGATPTTATGNPLLATNGKAWYWVEVLPYDTERAPTAGPAAVRWQPNITLPLVYRITALAQGFKPGTQAVVQSTYVPDPVRNE
jgi:type IV pilus assembly protein PilX